MFYPFILFCLAGLTAFDALPTWGDAPERCPVRIGILAPLSGIGAEYGDLIVSGARIGAQEVQVELEKLGLRLELIPEDDRCEGRAALSAYESLTRIKKVDLILGPLCNAATIPLLPIAERDRALLITTGLATNDILSAGSAVFNLLPPVGVVAKRIAEFGFHNLGRRKVSLLSVENEFGEENRRIFSDAWRNLGGRIITQESFPMDTRDFRTLLTKVKFDSSDVLYVVGYVPHYTVLIRQMQELGITKPLLAASTCQSWEVLDAVGDKPVELYYAHPGLSSSASYERLSAAFFRLRPEAKRGVPMLYLAGGYDGVRIIAEAVKGCRPPLRECLRGHLAGVMGFSGANGPVTFDALGNNALRHELEVRTIRKGQFVPEMGTAPIPPFIH